ncbi:MAG TPA: hypothetical protein VL360_03830 [Gammaproteobacteria bacterium]|jgi:hypothetical protein|nr:hypothetical protein [Gammaproteobacteria bacterium]
MSEIAVQAESAKTEILKIAKQAGTLASGLQNAAPGDKDAPNASIQYLIAITETLTNIADECSEIAHPSKAASPDDSLNSPGM